jgi:predicted PurR-regulated permease PerM
MIFPQNVKENRYCIKVAMTVFLWHIIRVKDVFKRFHSGRAVFFLMVFLCIVIIVGILKIAASVILPFTVALLLAFALYPFVKALDKLHFPRLLSILLIVLLIIAGLYGLGVILFESGKTIMSLYPKYESRFIDVYKGIARFFELSYDDDLSFIDNLWSQLGIRTFVRTFTLSFSNFFITFLKNAFLVVLFLMFLLVEASNFKEKLTIAFEGRSERINQIGHDLMNQITRYLTAKFLISLVTGMVFALALYIVGLEFAVIWGVIQFFLNFIPTLGSVAAAIGIFLFALIQFWPNPVPVILIIVIVLLLNIVLGNILDPKIIGEHVGISPLMILLSLLIWGWIWGFTGMVVAVPMMVIIKIVCENVPILEPVSIFIGSRKAVQTIKTENEASET